MVLDASVLVAILQEEDGYEDFVAKISQAPRCVMSAVSYMEASIALLKRRGNAFQELDEAIIDIPVEIVPVTPLQVQIARVAYERYGKGRHPAKLNLGDCFTYALAKQTGESLLFKGNDFSQTDLLLV